MKTQTVHGIPCHLKKRSVRAIFNSVLDQIKQKYPKDYRRLLNIVQEIKPWEGDEEGTMGEWIETGYPDLKDPTTWEYGFVDTPGYILINEKVGNSHEEMTANIAHELGHAAVRDEDLERRGQCNCDGWAEEMSADWYAYKWGFGRQIRKQSKIRDWMHHGPLPGHTFEADIDGKTYHYRVSRNFVFHLVNVTPIESKLRACPTV